MQNGKLIKACRIKIKEILFFTVTATLVISAAVIALRIARSPCSAASDGYLLMLTQCTLGAVGMFLPALAKRYLKFAVPNGVLISYYLFIYCAIFLGEVLSFYYTVPLWDSTLHAASSAMLTLLGLSICTLLCQNNVARVAVKPIFVYLFAFGFALAVGVLWEIYEFTFDAMLGLNMQKFQTAAGVDLVGRAALADTMKDIIIDTVAAFITAAITYISHKRKDRIYGNKRD